MLQYPDVNPIALQIGPLAVHWYGITYLIGFLAGWGLGTLRARQTWRHWTSEQVSDLIFYAALGVVLGGRIGYMLFYDFAGLLADPTQLFKIWQGGMSFHGGCLGVMVAMWLYGRKVHKPFFELTDFMAPLVPIGLAAGRVGNFINGELWGRVTTVPWGMVFPSGGVLPRHPSQLYECALEGMVLFILLWFYSAQPRPRMAVSALFLIGYGSLRIVAECFRQPDIQLGFIAFNWLTMGQLLSLPMVLVGILMLVIAYRKNACSNI